MEFFGMRQFRFILSLALVLLLFPAAGCAKMETHASADLHGAVDQDSYILMVRTGDPTLDRFLYHEAYSRLKSRLHMVGEGESTGTIEITFADSAHHALLGTSGAYGRYNYPWYSGHGSSLGIGIGLAGDLTWQNCTMLMVIKGTGGKEIWSARYDRKGKLGFGGSGTVEADSVARLCLGKILARLDEALDRKPVPGAKEPAVKTT
jgi:hypothetical protein